jgi:phosphoserine phosphatase RsbU/P
VEDREREDLLRGLERERALRRRAERLLEDRSHELALAADELLEQVDALVERDRLAAELAVARRIQRAVLPPPLSNGTFEVASAMDAAESIGGDFCDAQIVGDALWLAIGDVSGHGVDAGLVMIMAQSGFAALVHAMPTATPELVLHELNRLLHDNVRKRMLHDDHMTFVAVRAEADGAVRVAGAHDLEVIVVRRDGAVELYDTTGVWLGIVPHLPPLEGSSLRLAPGDLLALATDGLIDTIGPGRERYGMGRLIDGVARGRDAPVGALVADTCAQIDRWRAAGADGSRDPLRDDVTLLVARYLGRDAEGNHG